MNYQYYETHEKKKLLNQYQHALRNRNNIIIIQ